MLLAIDIGNTNITLGVWDGRGWQRQWRLSTVSEKTADEYGLLLRTLLQVHNLHEAITNVILCNVVPALTPTFSSASQQYLGKTAVNIDHSVNTGIRILTDNPTAVGADRVVNAVAAGAIYPGPSITIDMGTATKFDVVSSDGDLLGGVIAPGLRLAADSLVNRAAKLSHVPLEAPPQVLGRNTMQAMQSGIIFGYVGLIEGIMKRLLAEHPEQGQPVRIIGTGGLINMITGYTDLFDYVDPWLTLTGLRIIHERTGTKNI